MLGIILGVASLVGMAAIIKGMENGMRESMIAMGGADRVRGEEQDVPPEQDHLADQAPGRTLNDVIALRESAPLLPFISPQMDVDDVAVTRGEHRLMTDVVGVWPQVLDVNLHVLEHGRFFTAIDEEHANPVCVIGTGIRDELFGSLEQTGREIIPVGESVFLNGQPFTIIGMFQHYEGEQEKRERELAKLKEPQTNAGPARARGWGRRANYAFWRKNQTLYIPLNTAWIRFRAVGDTNGIPDNRLSDIDVKISGIDHLEASLQQA